MSTMMSSFGFDYGTKPTILVLGDVQFPDLLRRGFTALAYGELPYFGVLANPPFLAMNFDDEHLAREAFGIFKGWSDASGDGDAVGVGFIEFASGEYGMCIYPEPKRLISRCISDVLRPEVQPILGAMGHLKMFPKQSEGYSWFKSVASSSYFVLTPATIEHGPLLELAFRKREVTFYLEEEVPENSIEGALLNSRAASGKGELSRPIPAGARPSAQEIQRRRKSQLSRFFPVTLERLGFNTTFIGIQNELLQEGYREWQVTQAACNISLRQRSPELFPTELGDPETGQHLNVLDYLLNNSEKISDPSPSDKELSIAGLREQILLDSYNLLQYVTAPNVPDVTSDKLESELEGRGLLDE